MTDDIPFVAIDGPVTIDEVHAWLEGLAKNQETAPESPVYTIEGDWEPEEEPSFNDAWEEGYDHLRTKLRKWIIEKKLAYQDTGGYSSGWVDCLTELADQLSRTR